MIELAPTMKRLVFHDAETGVYHLCGDERSDNLAVTAGPLKCGDRLVPFISLVAVRRKIALYREPMVPKSYGSMNPRQQ